ncbi:hypothetical protein CSV78_12230 [Sporosarcina sp. P16a]|uniref:hypothetical protein n=1 Tax=unclassified Sporosarcina TaxID=2647733 RepID=UPI000C165921|nr:MULTISPECIES: hypothetical protein [unclassified Sporosarcina]PIC66566.1 hypothetical protein CSV78_12230 [Sporosarcina sp. P16a]PIC93137.1 hypothetical protein CSV70_06125 [Sporosarcina sp. P25]
MKKLSLLLLIVGLLTGCSEKGTDIKNTTSYDERSIENVLMNNEHVKLAKVLLYEDELLAGIRVNTFSRFQKKTIAGKIQKKLEREYPDLKITVSADSKILMETEKLINKKSEKNYRKKIDKIKSIEKEQT